ncbi:MAG TPA: hypothetical protein VFM18_05620, partial [Methanosarcina sp.]|nr:hypothetical protein [Methanosarcina sp.]
VLNVENRVKKAFDELKLISDVLLQKLISVSTDDKIVIESTRCVGSSYDFLEKYKFILGNDHDAAVFGASGMVGTHEFYRDAVSGYPQNWKISDFGYIKFTDIYTYPDGYYSNSPLTLSGNWHLDGSQELDGVFNITNLNTIGQYKVNTDKRLSWALGVDITVMPAFPIEDSVTVDDSISYSLSVVFNETVAMTDGISSIANYNYQIDESLTSADSLTGLYTYISQIDESLTSADSIITTFNSFSAVSSVTPVDQITTVGTDAPKDSTTSSDVVSFVVATTTGINETPINSGPL